MHSYINCNHSLILKHQVISTRKVQTEDGTLFLDMKCGNLMQQRITRIQTDQVCIVYHNYSSIAFYSIQSMTTFIKMFPEEIL